MSDLLAIDPQGMAEKLAYYDVMTQRTQLQNQQKLLATKQNALKSLNTSLSNFRTALKDLNKLNNGILQNQVNVSKEGMVNVTANSSASKGNYSFYVEQLASNHQLSLNNMTDESIASAQGSITIEVDGKKLDIDMSQLNSLSDLSNAINRHSDNPGVTASLVRTDGQVNFVLASNESGEKNSINIIGLEDSLPSAEVKEISAAKDAIVWMGNKGEGLKLTNSSNHFNNIIDGVTIDFKQVHGNGDAPLNITIDNDPSATKEQINKFVDSYNALMAEIDELTKRDKNGSGAFAGDSSIAVLKSQLNNLIRTSVDGHTLMEVGITADRHGKLVVDNKKLDNILQKDPNILTSLFNGDSGLINQVDKSLDSLLNTRDGQIKMRQESLKKQEDQLFQSSEKIEARYESAYKRYLTQFTQLQKVMAQMNSTMNMFNSIQQQS